MKMFLKNTSEEMLNAFLRGEGMRIKVNSYKWVVFLLFLFLSMMFFMRWTANTVNQLSGGQRILDLTFAVSPEITNKALDSYNPQAAGFYRYIFLMVDFVYAMTYCTFYRSAISYFCSRLSVTDEKARVLTSIPMIGMIGDIVENNIIFLLLSPVNRPEWLCIPLMLFNAVKFIFVYTSLAIVLGGFICLIKKRLSS